MSADVLTSPDNPRTRRKKASTPDWLAVSIKSWSVPSRPRVDKHPLQKRLQFEATA